MASTGGPGDQGGVRPSVAVRGSSLPIWIFAGAMLLLGLWLFSLLDANRRSLSAPPVTARDGGVTPASASSVPPLFVPPVPEPAPTPIPTPTPKPAAKVAPSPRRPEPTAPPPPQIFTAPPTPSIIAPPPPPIRPQAATETVLIVDTTASDTPAAAAPAAGAAADSAIAASARATVMRHRPTTVPQGTLIPAVLESALDSTRPGLARAIVSRDVRGIGGTRVLIPRGSQLIGEYRADLQPGQNRALVTWTRLVRPDGVTIAIASPAADAQGRAGIKGKVNSHFFERFGSAILQSALDIGVNVASRAGSDGSIAVIGLPNTVQTTTQPLTNGAQIQPTLTVPAGQSIMVFVARDLDFTSVESPR